MRHKPVLLQESLEALGLKPGDTVVDGTLGSGGHSEAILGQLGSEGRLIGLDRDADAIERSRQRLGPDHRVVLRQTAFADAAEVLDSLNVPEINAVLLDIGISSDQLEEPQRGFSFEREGPLDMRMDARSQRSARDIVNTYPERQLESLFIRYGEEKWSRRFASAIVTARQQKSIDTTTELADLLQTSLPRHFQFKKGRRPAWARHHPATRVFQALRIETNGELEQLEKGIDAFWNRLSAGGRLVIISFHSLEDRIVKQRFKGFLQAGQARMISKKPVCAGREEVLENPRARSAKLRRAEKELGQK